ncbi:MAG: hypothetical protein HOC70_15965 [Gammaproteobacteria bacterium]|jgi:hypothetical protein|nr:hypothetical protein [Gammaproteobacteria bacterium]MBT4494740.1 hypothetical protein [Gammaproteobacteria bacterium]MBT7370384.1 hypothetical protein [Gammaproteobacteria bacterium]
MNSVRIYLACGILMLVSGMILVNAPAHFSAFGTMYEPDAFYGSGNLYLTADASVAWTILLLSLAVILGIATNGNTHLDVDRLLHAAGSRFPWIVCGLIFLVAQLVSIFVFDRHPRDVDHVARLFQAKMFASGQLTLEAPPLPEFFSVFAVLVHEGELFSKYAPGGALFFAIPEFLFGTSLNINPLLGSISAGLFYLAFLNWFDERTARLTLIFAALSPWFLFTIASFHSHVPALFLFSVILYLFSRVGDQQGYCRELVLAGLAGGIFVMTRELTSVLICFPLVLGLLVSSPKLIPVRVAALATGVLVPLCMLLGYNYRLTGDAMLFPHLLADPNQVPWFGYKGHTLEKGFAHVFESLRLMNVNMLGWPISFLFLPFLLLQRSSVSLVLFLCFLWLVFGYFANYWNDYSLGVRYYFEATPVLFLLAALGFWQLYDRVGESVVFNRTTQFWIVIVFYSFSAFVYVPKILPLYANHYNGNVYTRVDDYARSLPELGALIFCSDAGGENGGYSAGFLANPLNLAELSRKARDGNIKLERPIFARDLGERNTELMALFPELAYYRYRFDPQNDSGEFFPLAHDGTESGPSIRIAKD